MVGRMDGRKDGRSDGRTDGRLGVPCGKYAIGACDQFREGGKHNLCSLWGKDKVCSACLVPFDASFDFFFYSLLVLRVLP